MPTPLPKLRLRLHRYDGRERGLMIVGSREAMGRLATQIADALASDPGPSAEFPRRLAEFEAVGLDRTEEPLDLSFHLDSDPPFRRRSSNPAFGSLWSLCLALVGSVAIVVLLCEHLR